MIKNDFFLIVIRFHSKVIASSFHNFGYHLSLSSQDPILIYVNELDSFISTLKNISTILRYLCNSVTYEFQVRCITKQFCLLGRHIFQINLALCSFCCLLGLL